MVFEAATVRHVWCFQFVVAPEGAAHTLPPRRRPFKPRKPVFAEVLDSLTRPEDF